MKNKTAAFTFMGICVLLVILLLTEIISPLISGIIFAVSLVALGILSTGLSNR